MLEGDFMKPIAFGLISLAAALVLTGCSVEVHSSAFAPTCRYSEDRSATVALDGATRLAVDAGAGDLRIEGRPGLTEVRVSGRACSPDADLISRVQVRTGKSGDTIRVETEIPATIGNSPTLALTLEVPESLLVNVRDGSGDTRIARVAEATVNDGSGDLEITGVPGVVTVDDESGGIEIRDVGSISRLRDQSGDIRINGVRGDLEIDQDASGDITITDVGGNVTITEDQSGDIDVRNIKGDFTVGRDSSGDIRRDLIGGRVTIPNRH
jgi:hypothetical protein